jgi:hypothetical protein
LPSLSTLPPPPKLFEKLKAACIALHGTIRRLFCSSLVSALILADHVLAFSNYTA